MKRFLLLLLATAGIAWAEGTRLHFNQIDLTDGRTLRNVTIKTYDNVSGRVLIITEGKASTVALTLFPSPLDQQISARAPRAGTTSTVVPQRVLPPPQEAPPAANPDRTASDQAEAAAADSTLEQHRSAARARADRYFRTEYNLGSGAVRVRSVDLDTRLPEPVAGWSGRYRTQGRAFIEFFDSKGWSYSRSTAAFEVLTQQKPDGQISISEFALRHDVDDR